MPSSINKEKLFAYICNELDAKEADEVEMALKSDPQLKLQYDEFINIRNLHVEAMSPILNPIMPMKTKNLIQSVNKSQTRSWYQLLNLGPIALVGWLGFASVGTIQIASLVNNEPNVNSSMMAEIGLENNMRSASNSKIDKEADKQVLSLLEEEIYTFQVGDIFVIKKLLETSENMYKNVVMTFKVIDMTRSNNKTCVKFETKSNLPSSEITIREICIKDSN
ncbi:hypothetical protein OA527_01150 [Pelagibacteraceae bacterium]|nr:hypothetical protein [Pelagibacteraceae bacterium]